MNSHLKVVPGIGSFSARGFSSGDVELLGWDSDWSSGLEFVLLSVGNDLRTGLLEGFDFLSSDGKSISS